MKSQGLVSDLDAPQRDVVALIWDGLGWKITLSTGTEVRSGQQVSLQGGAVHHSQPSYWSSSYRKPESPRRRVCPVSPGMSFCLKLTKELMGS